MLVEALTRHGATSLLLLLTAEILPPPPRPPPPRPQLPRPPPPLPRPGFFITPSTLAVAGFVAVPRPRPRPEASPLPRPLPRPLLPEPCFLIMSSREASMSMAVSELHLPVASREQTWSVGRKRRARAENQRSRMFSFLRSWQLVPPSTRPPSTRHGGPRAVRSVRPWQGRGG